MPVSEQWDADAEPQEPSLYSSAWQLPVHSALKRTVSYSVVIYLV